VINLLENEEPLADLRRGAIQRLTADILSLKTIVLTNKRLILIKKRVGSFDKKYIFLKDVQSLESIRKFNIPLLVLAIFLALVALGTLSSTPVLGYLLSAGVVFCAINVKKNIFRISTMTENLDFLLKLNFSTDLADRFIDRCQIEIDKLKHK
jgi:hypothetical protein